MGHGCWWKLVGEHALCALEGKSGSLLNFVRLVPVYIRNSFSFVALFGRYEVILPVIQFYLFQLFSLVFQQEAVVSALVRFRFNPTQPIVVVDKTGGEMLLIVLITFNCALFFGVRPTLYAVRCCGSSYASSVQQM